MARGSSAKKLIYAIIIAVILIVGILTIEEYRIANLPVSPECPQPEEKALVNAIRYDWAQNIDDPSEMIFSYSVFNYGDAEAKNIQVRCKVQKEDGNILVSVPHNFGNLASHTTDYAEFVTDIPDAFTEDMESSPADTLYYTYCYIESCDDCEILWQKIPELVDIYGGEGSYLDLAKLPRPNSPFEIWSKPSLNLGQ